MLKRLGFVTVIFLAFSQALGVPPTDQARAKLEREGRWEQLLELREAAAEWGLDQSSRRPEALAAQLAASPEAVNFRVLCILVDFWDRLDSLGYAKGTAGKFDTLLFSSGAVPTGSMKEYWDEVAYGEISVSGDVVGWFRMPEDYSYYASSSYGFGAYPHNSRKLCEDAVQAADSLGVDFSDYDGNGDGVVDAIVVVFAGLSAGETGDPDDLWSVRWNNGASPPVIDGVSLQDYFLQSEETIYGPAGLSNIGYFCYNLGQAMGLRGLYDGDGDANGLGLWSLMADGMWLNYGKTPAHLDAFSRWSLGLVSPEDLILPTSNTTVLLPPVETSPSVARVWRNGLVVSEFFLVENRQKLGFDTYLPGEGILIYHVDLSTPNMVSQWIEGEDPYGGAHYRVALEQADGLYDLERMTNYGDAGDPWNDETPSFDISSYPSSRSYAGNPTEVAVTVQAPVGDSYLVDLYVTTVDPPVDSLPHTIVGSGTGDFYYAEAADLDRDNRTDLVYSDPSDNGLHIAFGAVDGTLEFPFDYATVGPAAIAIDFVNADTLLDVVAATSTSVTVLVNRGSRSFQELPPLLAGNLTLDSRAESAALSPSDEPVPSIVTGLFDGDEILDMVVAPGEIYYGTGDGSFIGPTTLPFVFSNVNSCDFNYDGSDDLVTLSGDAVVVYLNDGLTPPTFAAAATITVGLPSLEIPPSSQVADLDYDGDCDFVIVTPLADPSGQSLLTAVFWNYDLGLDRFVSIPVDGVAYDLVVVDADRDEHLDIVVANGSLGRLEFYFGDGLGNFSQPPVLVDLETAGDISYVLATLDLNRDGNPDYVSGATGGGTTRLAYSDSDPAPVIQDESYMPMTTSVSTDVSVSVVNPAGFVISRDFQTVSGADYWRVDFNQDGLIEEQAVDYNVMPGEYFFTAKLHPDAAANTTISMGIGIDGSQTAIFCQDYDPGLVFKNGSDSFTFYYEVYSPGQAPPISPPNGSDVRSSSPTFTWDGLPAGPEDLFSFGLCDVPTMAMQKTDSALGLPFPQYALTKSLEIGNVYYWQVGFDRDRNGVYEDYSRVYAVRVVECCVGFVGNVNVSGDGSAFDEIPTIQDIALLIDHLFLTQNPLPCEAEADVNASGDITIGDISVLIGHLFLTQDPLRACPGLK